jgi:hypothetical protein
MCQIIYKGPCILGGVDSKLCHRCKEEKRNYLLSVLRIHPVRGGAAAFLPWSVAACGFRIWFLDVPALLHSTQCATTFVIWCVLSEGWCQSSDDWRFFWSPDQLARSMPRMAVSRPYLYHIQLIDKIAIAITFRWRAGWSRAHMYTSAHVSLIIL